MNLNTKIKIDDVAKYGAVFGVDIKPNDLGIDQFLSENAQICYYFMGAMHVAFFDDYNKKVKLSTVMLKEDKKVQKAYMEGAFDHYLSTLMERAKQLLYKSQLLNNGKIDLSETHKYNDYDLRAATLYVALLNGFKVNIGDYQTPYASYGNKIYNFEKSYPVAEKELLEEIESVYYKEKKGKSNKKS